MPNEEVATAYLALANGLSLLKLVDTEAVPEHLYGDTVALVHQGLVARRARQGGIRVSRQKRGRAAIA